MCNTSISLDDGINKVIFKAERAFMAASQGQL